MYLCSFKVTLMNKLHVTSGTSYWMSESGREIFQNKKKKLSIVGSGENKVNSSALLSEQIEAGSESLDSQSKRLYLVLFSGRSVFVCCIFFSLQQVSDFGNLNQY